MLGEKWVVARAAGHDRFEFLHADGWRPVILGARTFGWAETALEAGRQAADGRQVIIIDLESGKRREVAPDA